MASLLAQLETERSGLLAQSKALVAAAEKDGRDLSDEEKARDDELFAHLDALKPRIEREQRRRDEALQAVAVSPQGAPNGSPQRVQVKDVAAADDPKWGWRDLGEFALAVRRASDPSLARAIDPRLARGNEIGIGAAPTNYHQETNSPESYLVPPAMRQEIWELVFSERDSLLNLVDAEPTSSNVVELLADESTPWGATGIQARWRAEASQMTPSRLDLEARQVRLHELYAFVLATEELLQDAPRLNARLTGGAARAIRWKADDAIMWGTGAGQPLGWMSAVAAPSTALVSVAAEGGQTADTIVAANAAKMFARQINPGRAVWIANNEAITQLVTMVLGTQPIWTPPATGLVNAPGGFLFGRPILFSEHAAALGDLGDIQLVDPDGYYATVRQGGIQSAESIHLYFDYNIRAFRWTFRFGGQPFLSAPVTPARGSSTKSHFVALAAR